MANYFGFIDESGVLDAANSAQPFFAVGMLKIEDTSKIGELLTKRHYDYFSKQKEHRRQLIRGLRDNPRALNNDELNLLLTSTRHVEYKFTNIQHQNLDIYKALLDTSFEFPLHFCAIVIDKTDPLFDKTLYKNYWYAYMKYARLLCEKNCGTQDQLCVIADYMNKPNNSDKFFEHEINEVPQVFNTIRAHSETFTLLQICDLLLGSVVFQWKLSKGLSSNSRREQAKAEFVNHLTSKFGIITAPNTYPLARAVTYNSPCYFSVWPLKLNSTKKDGGV